MGFRHRITGRVTKFTFKRKFDTCDNRDYIIEEGTTHVIWSRGKEHLVSPKGLNVTVSTRDDHGMVRVNLLKNLQANNKLPNHVKPLDLLAEKVKVPAEETTYWCRVFKLPNEFLKQKHHIYQVKINYQ